MQSKSFVKLLRKVIREEVRSAVTDILTEQKIDDKQIINHGMKLSEIASNPKRTKKVYSKNSMLNDILNETAGLPADGPIVSQGSTDYPSMGSFKSDMAETFTSPQRPDQPVVTHDVNGKPVNMNNESVAKTVGNMTKNYSGMMAKMREMDKRKGKKRVV